MNSILFVKREAYDGFFRRWVRALTSHTSAPVPLFCLAMKRFPLFLAFLLTVPAMAQVRDLGTTAFENTGAATAQEPFLRGLLLLHSFEFDDAAEAFREAQERDPGFAMAYWGEAMTYNHPLWAQVDLDKGRATLNRLAPTPDARQDKAPTAREKAYLRAVETLYGTGDKRERDWAYRRAMEHLAAQFPDDLDAAAFYALSILGTSHDGRDIPTYMQAAAVAEEVFMKNPAHPGAQHYLIHSYDDPVHAPLGLRAALRYAETAPAAAHALHMPSHIFVALGMWDRVVASNDDAWRASLARVARKGLPEEMRRYGYHALWWQHYGEVQQGRYEAARQSLATIAADAERFDNGSARTHYARMRAAYVVGTQSWTGAEAQPNIRVEDLSLPTRASEWYIRARRALAQGDRATALQHAAAIRDALATDRRQHPPDLQSAEIIALEIEALAAANADDALALLAQATDMEENLSFDFGPPVPVEPSHELYGQMLLAMGRAEEAVAQFEEALARAPRRTTALLGLAQAAEQAGDRDTAAAAYLDLRAAWHNADTLPAAVRTATEAMGSR